MAVAIALPVAALAPKLVAVLYGSKYAAAGMILRIHIWAGVFVFMRQLLSRWLIIEGLLVYSLVTHGLGAVGNVVLNAWLIPLHGGIGAAVATLLSYAMASYFGLFFAKRTRGMAAQMTFSLCMPFRAARAVRGLRSLPGLLSCDD